MTNGRRFNCIISIEREQQQFGVMVKKFAGTFLAYGFHRFIDTADEAYFFFPEYAPHFKGPATAEESVADVLNMMKKGQCGQLNQRRFCFSSGD